MKTAVRFLIAFALVSIIGLGHGVRAQTEPTGQRLNDEQVKSLLGRIERGANNFKSSLSTALDESKFSSTRAEDKVNEFIQEFEAATNRLKERFSDNNAATGAVQDVLQHSVAINMFMLHHPLTAQAQSDWDYLRSNLNELARVYHVSWVWPGVAAKRPYRVNDKQMADLLKQIEQKSDYFRAAIKSSLNHSSLDDTSTEDNLNQFVRNFEIATDRLENRFDDDFSTTGAATEVLRRAFLIDRFMKQHKLTPSAQNSWTALRGDLDELGRSYNFGVDWNAPAILIRIERPGGNK